MQKRIGFIGLGIMGKPMAKNLLAAGFPLTVYDLRKPPMDEVVGAGAKAATSPAEVAAASDVAITMVRDTPDVEEVILGNQGVLESAKDGLTIIDMSTISASATQKIATAAQEKGVKMLDAPVSGGESGAIAGTLSIMVGGEKETFEECRPIFEVLGKNVVYMGESGMGQTTKACNQAICVLNILATCEGLILGAKAGLAPKKLLEAVTAGAAGSWMLSNLGPKMLERDFEPGFTVGLQQKDLRLVLELADEKGVSLPGTSLVHQLFRSIEADGNAEKGTQALVTALEKLASFKLVT